MSSTATLCFALLVCADLLLVGADGSSRTHTAAAGGGGGALFGPAPPFEGMLPWAANPVIEATQPRSPGPCADNIYSQELVNYAVGGQPILLMFYGGWEADLHDCHDKIYLAYSLDGGGVWRKRGGDKTPLPVLSNGASQHVNDPSVFFLNGQWYMYYTDCVNAVDRVWLASGSSLVTLQKQQQIVGPGPAGSWCEVKVGRPAVIFEDGVFMMWYDGTDAQGERCVGFANSTDGLNFKLYDGNPIMCPGGGIDVKKINGTYYMVSEGQKGSTLASSLDGIHWVYNGTVVPLSGTPVDAYGQVVPSFQLTTDGTLVAVWYGAANNPAWDTNRIAVAYAQGTNVPTGGGCVNCAAGGLSCAVLCEQDSTEFNDGECQTPGSTDPGNCCHCFDDGCSGCLAGEPDCHAACNAAGAAGGWCAYPGSQDSSRCCACFS